MNPRDLSWKYVRNALLIAAGVGLVCLAVVMTDQGIEALLGASSGSLSWGPKLFRALLAGHGFALVIGGMVSWRSRRLLVTSQRLTSQQAMAHESITTTRTWLILAALSLIALALRLWQLNTDLWYDELISLLDFIRPPLSQIITSFSSQNQHMLYSILAHGSVSLFGESAGAARLPSVIFGVGSLWALFLLGRRLIGVRESLLACALMTVSYHHIWFSQNARGYMGFLFFAVLATWLLLEALERDTWNFWIGYAVAVCLGMWLHMTMAFVVAAHGLLYLGRLVLPRVLGNASPNGALEKNSTVASRFSWKPIVGWLLCLTLTLQLHALALPEFLRSALHQESLPSEWSSPWWVVIESLRSLQIGFSGILVVACGVALVGAGFLSILRRNTLAGLALTLPALLGATTMLVLGHYIWPRFFFFSMGFAILIAVHGALTLPSLILNVEWFGNRIARLAPRQSRRRVGELTGLVLASLLIAASVVTLPRLYALPKQDFTGARNWVERSRAPEDKVVAVGLAGVAYSRYFAPEWSVAQTQEELDAIRNDSSNVWLVYILPIQMKAYRPAIWNTIQKEFETVEVFPGTLGGGGVYVCRQRNTSAAAQASTKQPHPNPKSLQ